MKSLDQLNKIKRILLMHIEVHGEDKRYLKYISTELITGWHDFLQEESQQIASYIFFKATIVTPLFLLTDIS